MTLKGKTLLKGHALISEGALLFNEKGCQAIYSLERRNRRAKCECGALSPPEVRSVYAARKWHRAHKDSLR